jgi:uncharacterized protein (DUF983 family)
MRNFEQRAVRMLLNKDEGGLTNLRAELQAVLHPTCPECGDGLMDNGFPRDHFDYSVRCTSETCDYGADPNA